MSLHFHFSRLTSHFNSRAPVGDFMNGWVWTAAPDAISPHFGQICSRQSRKGRQESSSGSWHCTAAGSQSSNTVYGYIKQQGSGPTSLYGILLGSTEGQGPPGFKHGPLLHYMARVRFRLKSWMRKGDIHLELLIYLTSFLQRQSPSGVPCWGRHWAPWPAVLPWFWPWQRSPVCCLTRNSPGYYRVCDLSMCGSLTRPSTTLCLGRSWNTPVYPLIVCPSVGWEGAERERGGGGTWTGSMATKTPELGTVWRPRGGKKTTTCSLQVGQKAVIRFRYLLAEQELHQPLMQSPHLHLYHWHLVSWTPL